MTADILTVGVKRDKGGVVGTGEGIAAYEDGWHAGLDAAAADVRSSRAAKRAAQAENARLRDALHDIDSKMMACAASKWTQWAMAEYTHSLVNAALEGASPSC